MSNQSNFPIISELVNYQSATITNGGQKGNGGGWVAATYVDVEVPLTGEWYWEYITDNYVYAFMGIGRLQFGSPHHHNTDFSFVQGGEYRYNGSNQANTNSIGTGDIIGVYVNNGITKVYVNNSLDHTYTQNLSIVGEPVFPVVFGTSNTTINFGQDSSFLSVKTAQGNTDGNGIGDFYYTPPGNALALCSANSLLNTNQDPSEGTPPNNYFDAVGYTGNGGTLSISSLNFQPDMVWIKNRSASDDWCVQDAINGVGKTKAMNSAAGYASETDCITAFNSNGFTMSNDHKVNASGENYIAYCFKESQEAGLDMFAYTGTGGGNQVVSHSLGETPKMVWIFLVSGSNTDTMVYIDTPYMGTSYGIFPSLTNARQAASYVPATGSSNITVGSSANATGRGYFAMLWAERAGFSKYGQYTGNGSTNGPFIHTGFKPKMIFLKRADGAGSWLTSDSERRPFNDGTHRELYLNSNSTEATGADSHDGVDYLSNGFKLRGSNAGCNGNGNKYIYGAWADIPAKFSNAF